MGVLEADAPRLRDTVGEGESELVTEGVAVTVLVREDEVVVDWVLDFVTVTV